MLNEVDVLSTLTPLLGMMLPREQWLKLLPYLLLSGSALCGLLVRLQINISPGVLKDRCLVSLMSYMKQTGVAWYDSLVVSLDNPHLRWSCNAALSASNRHAPESQYNPYVVPMQETAIPEFPVTKLFHQISNEDPSSIAVCMLN